MADGTEEAQAELLLKFLAIPTARARDGAREVYLTRYHDTWGITYAGELGTPRPAIFSGAVVMRLAACGAIVPSNRGSRDLYRLPKP